MKRHSESGAIVSRITGDGASCGNESLTGWEFLLALPEIAFEMPRNRASVEDDFVELAASDVLIHGGSSFSLIAAMVASDFQVCFSTRASPWRVHLLQRVLTDLLVPCVDSTDSAAPPTQRTRIMERLGFIG